LTGLASDAKEEVTSLLRNEIRHAKVGDLSLPHPGLSHQADDQAVTIGASGLLKTVYFGRREDISANVATLREPQPL
jgi:hypothetical protein